MIKGRLELDDVDRKIIALLEANSRSSQGEIAKHVNISQPAVGMRIHKLRKRGVISTLTGVNFKDVELYLAKVDVTADDTTEILDFFRKCPYFLNGMVTTGKYNLCLFFAAEDVSTLEAITGAHLRSNEHVKNVEFNLVLMVLDDFILPLKIDVEKQRDHPCGYETRCEDCHHHQANRCLGCPATCYKGNVWKKS